jgi:hypothetical protein
MHVYVVEIPYETTPRMAALLLTVGLMDCWAQPVHRSGVPVPIMRVMSLQGRQRLIDIIYGSGLFAGWTQASVDSFIEKEIKEI